MSNTDTSYLRIVREVRIRATRLLKAARQGDAEAIKLLSGQLKRRHALDIAAHDLSGVAYLDLVGRSGNATIADPVRFFDRPLSSHWNHWFTRYEEAVAHLRLKGGYLFPFRSQFVVVDEHVLRSLDLDPENRIGAKSALTGRSQRMQLHMRALMRPCARPDFQPGRWTMSPNTQASEFKLPDPRSRNPLILPDGAHDPATVFLSEVIDHPNIEVGD